MAARLDDWIDEPIEVEFLTREENSEPQQTSYTLEGADERDVLLGYADEGNLSDYRMVFFPWHRVGRILLAEATGYGDDAEAATRHPQAQRPTEGVEHDADTLREWSGDVQGRPRSVAQEGAQRPWWRRVFGG